MLYDSTRRCMAVTSSCCEMDGSIQYFIILTNETSVNKLTMLCLIANKLSKQFQEWKGRRRLSQVIMALDTGLHQSCYNGNYREKQRCESEQIFNSFLSLECSLQLENIVKAELLVIAYHHDAVNKYLNFVHTARHDLDHG